MKKTTRCLLSSICYSIAAILFLIRFLKSADILLLLLVLTSSTLAVLQMKHFLELDDEE